jgi:cell fate (sporulation/competence/biofilm development) regulator YlbF (YheA/YmcA/DUF963 family)
MNPYVQAQRLVESLRECEEYKHLLQLQMEIEKSDELRDLLEDYQEIQEEVHLLQSMNQDVSDEIQEEMSRLSNLLDSIPVLQAYLEAERKMCIIIQDIQDMIMAPINEIFGGLDRKYNQM